MADEADKAAEYTEPLLDAKVAGIRQAAANIPAGEAGECDNCGEYWPRIVNRHCARCRDKLGLK